ncbi:MAG: AsmA-like C-terminal region-containing protein [bacterium]
MLLALRRFLTGLIVFLLLLGAVVWWGSGMIISLNGPKIAQQLEKELGPGFQVGEISGNIVQGILVTGCTAGPDPATATNTDPIIQAAKCRVVPDWLKLLSNHLELKQLVFSDVIVDLRRDAKGAVIWPPFIARAAHAQGASLATTPFGWRLDRAEVRFHGKSATDKPIVMQIQSAAGDYAPGDHFAIGSCQGDLQNASWSLNGSVKLNETRALSGTWKLKDAGLWELAQALTGSNPAGTAVDAGVIPSGLVTGDLAITGSTSDPEVTGMLHWREGAIRHFKVEQGDLDCSWRPGIFTLKDSVLKAYAGRLAVSGSIDFRRWPGHYDFDTKSEGIELGDFLADAGYGKLGLTGKFLGTFTGSGPLTDISSFHGSGHLEAAGGETRNPLADPALPDMPAVVQYQSLVTDLVLGSQTAQLSNTSMVSSDFTLTGAGTVTFAGDLDLTGLLTAPAKYFAGHPIYGPTIALLNLGDQQVPLDLVVTGTIQAPIVRAQLAGPAGALANPNGLGGFLKKLQGLIGKKE